VPAEKHTPTAKRRDEKASLYVLDPEDEIVEGRWYDEGRVRESQERAVRSAAIVTYPRVDGLKR
jgi:hypothetical protein